MAEVLDAFAIGGSPATLPSATTNTLLRDADPAIFGLLDYLAWGLTRAIQSRLLAELAALPEHKLNITSAVMTRLSRDPAAIITSEQVRFPALAIWRTSAEHSERTRARLGEASACSLLYVLPPMTAAQVEAIGPILRTVEVAAIAYMTTLQHPAYTPPGGTAGEDITTRLGVDFCFPRTTKFGAVESLSKGLLMPALALEFELSEVSRIDTDQLNAFERGDTAFDVRDGATDTVVADVIETETEIP